MSQTLTHAPSSGTTAASGAWFDAPDALAQVATRMHGDPALEEAGRVAQSIIERGLAQLDGVLDSKDCDAIVADFDRFVRQHPEYSAQHTDDKGRHLRFVNLHLASDAAMRAGNHPRLGRVLDFLFGRPSGIYTSLFFEYGSQQPMHRDSPFFHTYPKNQFVGVWIALEDIDPAAGPLMYMPGGHRHLLDPREMYERTRQKYPDRDATWCLGQALQVYYGAVITLARERGEPQTLPIRKGDAVIWHPELPHGGFPARDPLRTRKSIVFHCAPIGVQVHQHEAFFTRDDEPSPRYGFSSYRGRGYALAGEPAFQVPD